MSNNVYMLWGNFRTTPQEESEFAIQHYIEKYGKPPEILLHNADEPVEVMEGVEVRTAHYVPVGLLWLGMEEKNDN